MPPGEEEEKVHALLTQRMCCFGLDVGIIMAVALVARNNHAKEY